MKKRFLVMFLSLISFTMGTRTVWGGTEDGLVAHYRFSEGGGTMLYDHTPNPFNGTIHNAPW